MEAFYPLKRPKTRNRWPSEENAPKIIFFAEMGCIYMGPIYIKRQSDSDNFLTFWYTLLDMITSTHFAVFRDRHGLKNPSVFYGTLLPVP